MKKIEDEEFISKRISIKILKERRNKRVKFEPEEFKKAFINEFSKSEEMSEYHRRVTHQFERDDSLRASAQQEGSDH